MLTSFLFNEEQLTLTRRRSINDSGGKMKFRVFLFVLFVVACAPLPGNTASPDTAGTSLPAGDDTQANEPQSSPFLPQPGDEKLIRDDVFINDVSVVIRESDPPQISLFIGGNMPTSCHKLRLKIPLPDMQNNIQISAYSVAEPSATCLQVLEPFQVYIGLKTLPIGTFPNEHYSIWVNGELAGEFDS